MLITLSTLLSYFNSKMVRLIDLHCSNLLIVPRFQFQNGSINSGLTLQEDGLAIDFNSKMVRLIGVDKVINIKATHRFQFQNGSINRRLRKQYFCKYVAIFQFQNGSINRILRCCPRMVQRYFNSKMVRLIDTTRNETEVSILISIPKWFD